MNTFRTLMTFLTGISTISATQASGGGIDESLIRQLVTTAYFNGAFNDLDTDAMRNGFHTEFAIFSAEGVSLERYTITQWINAIEHRKAAADFDKQTAKRDCRIISVDVTGNSSAVKAEIFKDGRLLYTDYLSLLKFSNGWKIVGKVYFEQP